ncbi:MAG TPA: beta-N-acetylhexosaminidase, partial [Cyclobacteriaceae bacterium]
MNTIRMKVIAGFAIISCTLFPGCTSSPPTDLEAENIIPRPVSVTATGKAFELNKSTIIYTMDGEDGMVSVAQRLASQLNLATGFTNAIEVVDEEPGAGILLITEDRDDWGSEEAYVLTINPKLITIHAPTTRGAFYGVQTLVQLVPFGNPNTTYQIPTGTIRDTPRYGWRGAMLDVARHFFSVDDVKRYIDLISYYKINILHLHLSDDQGWRIEIKSWPNLALHGGSTQVGGGKGGYYTQDEYKDIVAYAASRLITIVPEIDMPSHTNAALASYGELNGGTIVPEEGRVVISN